MGTSLVLVTKERELSRAKRMPGLRRRCAMRPAAVNGLWYAFVSPVFPDISDSPALISVMSSQADVRRITVLTIVLLVHHRQLARYCDAFPAPPVLGTADRAPRCTGRSCADTPPSAATRRSPVTAPVCGPAGIRPPVRPTPHPATLGGSPWLPRSSPSRATPARVSRAPVSLRSRAMRPPSGAACRACGLHAAPTP